MQAMKDYGWAREKLEELGVQHKADIKNARTQKENQRRLEQLQRNREKQAARKARETAK